MDYYNSLGGIEKVLPDLKVLSFRVELLSY